jgi:hypothetical protein
MTNSQKKKRSRPQRPAKRHGRREFFIAIAVVLMAGIAAAVTLSRRASDRFDALKGRWLRPDGGYIFEIRAVDPSGKIDGVYLNPKPINIAKAEATRDGSTLKVFAEIRAPDYPGSTYMLTYYPQQDQLRGTYVQAAPRQSYNVIFVRMRER